MYSTRELFNAGHFNQRDEIHYGANYNSDE